MGWQRILLKLSGEALGSIEDGHGIDKDALTSMPWPSSMEPRAATASTRTP